MKDPFAFDRAFYALERGKKLDAKQLNDLRSFAEDKALFDEVHGLYEKGNLTRADFQSYLAMEVAGEISRNDFKDGRIAPEKINAGAELVAKVRENQEDMKTVGDSGIGGFVIGAIVGGVGGGLAGAAAGGVGAVPGALAGLSKGAGVGAVALINIAAFGNIVHDQLLGYEKDDIARLKTPIIPEVASAAKNISEMLKPAATPTAAKPKPDNGIV